MFPDWQGFLFAVGANRDGRFPVSGYLSPRRRLSSISGLRLFKGAASWVV